MYVHKFMGHASPQYLHKKLIEEAQRREKCEIVKSFDIWKPWPKKHNVETPTAKPTEEKYNKNSIWISS